MSTLPEIEAAADTLSPEEQQELLLYLAARLREKSGRLPAPRQFSTEQLRAWIADDEAEMRAFREEK